MLYVEELNEMVIRYIQLLLIFIILIDGVFGDWIIYMLKCRKGYTIIGKIIDLDCVHLARKPTYVSVFEYSIQGNKKLAVLTSYPDDKIGDEILLYINEPYIARNKIRLKEARLKIIFAIIWAIVIIDYIIIHWKGMPDIIAIVVVCCLLVTFVLYFPVLFKKHIFDVKNHLGWHVNL